ncbi:MULTISPECIES: hypothetical protein [Bradyrhizobium]|uniref:hypothetical protein n=1 Tax=Bradyrhizobium elkanii TaxID=29448 RepID=UPI0012BBAB0D|nr:hypothetical protein [Bradyrhizobium elkanii]
MSKPRLLLIHCSSGIRPGAKYRQHGRSFRPLVIDRAARASPALSESSWEAALNPINLGFLISITFLQVSMTILDAWTDPENDQPD